MKSRSLLMLVLPAVAAVLTAQTPDHLFGITRNIPALRHQSHTACAVLGQCALPGMPPATPLPPFVGGTAWDPTRSGAWVSNGVLTGKFDDNCTTMCPPAPLPSPGIAMLVTGLEVVEGLNQLWAIDSAGILHFYTNTCPPNPAGMCNTGLGPTAIGNVTSGLAVDELQGLVFIAHPVFPVGINRIVVTLLAQPCAPVAQFQLPPCFTPFGTVTGLACDWGNQILYATDGFSTVAMSYAWTPPTLTITGITCCVLPIMTADPLIGLAVRPGRATSTGMSCGNGACPPCPQVHTLLNDPVLGNAGFRLALDQAPANTFAWCLIGAAPCQVPGVIVPPLCGPVHTLPFLGTLGPNATGPATTPCDGATSFNLPLPIAPGLAGLLFSSQCLTVCFSTTGFGTGLSNCLSWQLQGN